MVVMIDRAFIKKGVQDFMTESAQGPAVREFKPKTFGSWKTVGTAKMSRDLKYVVLAINGKVYSLHVETLYDLISGYAIQMDVKAPSC
jgi:hypothetical protein